MGKRGKLSDFALGRMGQILPFSREVWTPQVMSMFYVKDHLRSFVGGHLAITKRISITLKWMHDVL